MVNDVAIGSEQEQLELAAKLVSSIRAICQSQFDGDIRCDGQPPASTDIDLRKSITINLNSQSFGTFLNFCLPSIEFVADLVDGAKLDFGITIEVSLPSGTFPAQGGE